MGPYWRLRFCFAAFGLALYVVVSALVSVSSVTSRHNSYNFPQGDEDGDALGGGGSGKVLLSRSVLNQEPAGSGGHAHARGPAPRLSPPHALDAMRGGGAEGGVAAGGHLLPRPLGGPFRMTPKRMRSRIGPTIEWCRSPLRFKAEPGPVVALASFPGSGNTWLRYLLQQATGLLTGSVYKDYALLKNGFPGENVLNGSVVAVKTHEYGPDSLAPFDRAVLLVREPGASLQAEFNRRSGGHVGHASAEKYRRNNGKYWHTFVHGKADEWAKMNLAWHSAFGGDGDKLLVVAYNDLMRDTRRELARVLEFLGLPDSDLECVMRRRDGIYKRSKKALNFDVFDNEMRALLLQKKLAVYRRLGLQVRDGDEKELLRLKSQAAARAIRAGRNATAAAPAATATAGPT